MGDLVHVVADAAQLREQGYRVLRIGLEKQVLDRLLIDTAPDVFVPVPRAIRTISDFLVLGDDRLAEVKYAASGKVAVRGWERRSRRSSRFSPIRWWSYVAAGHRKDA